LKKIFMYLFILLLVASVTVGCAEQAEPVAESTEGKSVTLVVGRGPGGSHDQHARIISSTISNYLGAPMVVDLRSGGSGAVGAEIVATSKPDGLTLLFGGIGSETTLFHVRDLPYTRESFIPIARINTSPTIIAVKEDSPFKTMQDLIDYAKENPGKLTYGSSGTFGSSHFPIEMLVDLENLDMVHVPFDGGGPCLMALLGNQVDFIGGMPSTVKSQYDAGEVRILAQMSTERIATLPDVPTLKELGYDIVYGNWRTVFTPAGTPEARVQELRTAFKKLMEDKSFQLLIKQLGEEVLYLDGPEFQVEWDREFAAQEKTAKRIADQFED